MTSKNRRSASTADSGLSLRERADAIKASAGKVVRKDSAHQPSQESLLGSTPVEQGAAPFPSDGPQMHGRPTGSDGKKDRDVASDRPPPSREHTMGRHETFQGATPISEELLRSTSLGSPESEVRVALTARNACPLFAIGTQIGRLVAEHSRQDNLQIDASGSSTRDQKQDATRIMERAESAIDLLRDAASYQQATSLEGALTQIVIAAGALGDISDGADLDDAGRQDRVDAILRCLHSIAKSLSAFTGVSTRIFGSDYLMPHHLDELGTAWITPRASYVIPGPKPTVDQRAVGGEPSIEQQLFEMNRHATDWWMAYDKAGDLENEADSNCEVPGAAARKVMAEMATAHAIRMARSNLIRAMELPATTVRELGLQARLVAVELNEWWDGNQQEAGETACRQLLARLIAQAGLTPILRRDLDVSEAFDWIANPLTHANRYGRHDDVPKKYNRTLPKDD